MLNFRTLLCKFIMKLDSMFGTLLFAIIAILNGEASIITTSKSNSWISMEDFSIIIQKSFPFSQCCNIYLTESVHDVEVLFKQFTDIYPYVYLVRQKIYDCQGYFLLGPTDKEIEKAMQKVPSSISTTEILIIINGELKNNSVLFNASLYGNSNTNLVTKSGIWTLSENYLKPRFFVRVDSYDKLRHEFDVINLRGREIRACTFYRPPVSYLNRTIKKTIDGIEEEVYLADNDKEKDGIEVKIFLLIAEKLNFTWTMQKPQGEYRLGRRVNKTHWNGGVIQLLRENKIDVAFGGIWLTADHNLFANMSEPWYQLFIHFLVPRPQPITSFWALTRPFPLEIWLLLIIMLLLESVYMCTRARIDPKFPKRFRSFLSAITELIGRLLGTWVPINTANARLELHLWQTAGVVLVTAYCSSLAARLASWEYEDRIDTVRQFLEANLSWGRKGKPPAFYDYFDMDDFYASQLPSRYVPVRDDEETHRLITNGGYGIIGRIVDTIFFPEDEVINEDLQNYRVMKQGVGNFYASFGVQPWLLQPIDKIILWLKETGITHFHLEDVIRRRVSFNLREVLKEYDGIDRTARVLGLMPLGAGFATLIVGLLISTMMFVYELKRAAGLRPIREVFRDIQAKRKVWEASLYKKRYRRNIDGSPRDLTAMNFRPTAVRSLYNREARISFVAQKSKTT